ncbi:MAG: hypothetical protein ACLVCR_06415 [Lachnospiraceae bacterium]
MRLGVVLTGIGACAAASAGALTWLLDAGVAPYAVCGMQAAAWPAALYLVGYDADRLRGAAAQAARAGRRLLTADASARDVLGMKKSAICRGRRLEKLLAAQTGERALGLCERQGVFLCRAARSGHVVAFCTQSMTQDGAIVTLQASTAFAARAALSRPPFVSPMEWMGSPLLPMDDVPLACRLLQTMGAQRVLVVAPQTALRHQPDALEQASGFFMPCAREIGGNVGVFRIPLPEKFGALSLSDLLLGADAGREAAAQGMEAALMRLGMPLCRVLPFRRKLTAP